MNRGMLFLLSAVCCGVVAVGCGDDSSSGGSDTGAGGTGAGSVGGSGGEGATGGSGGEDPTGGTGGTGGGAAATCASYCTTIMSACTAGNAQYGSQAACELECAAFEQGDAGAMAGNNLECRAYHAGVAATTEPEVHCVHAGPLGSGPTALVGCGDDPCTAFCNIAQEVCGAEATYSYASFDECNTACQAFTNDTDFNMTEVDGETLACRMYHLSAAAGNALNPHCGHLENEICQ